MTTALHTARPSPSVMARTAQPPAIRSAHRDYQTFWTTQESPGWLDRALDQEATWLRDKLGLDFDLSDEGEKRSDDGSKRAQILHRCSRKDRGTRLRVWNTNRDGTFTVTIMAVENTRGGWLQITVTASDPLTIAKKPRIAGMLLDVVDFEDVTPLRPDAAYTAVGGLDDLESLIDSPERRLPTIVAAPVDGVSFDTWNTHVNQWTKEAVGIAHVVSLDPPAAEEFAKRHGTNAVLPGTLRTYPAGADLADPVTARTARWLSHYALAGKSEDVERTIESFVRQHVASQPVPLPSSAREWSRAFDRIATGKLRQAVTPVSRSWEEKRERFAELQRDRAGTRAATALDKAVQPSEADVPTVLPDAPTAGGNSAPAVLEPVPITAPAPASAAAPELVRLRAEVEQLRNDLEEVGSERDTERQRLRTVQDTLMLEDLEEASLFHLVDLATKDVPDQAAISDLLHANETLESRLELRDEQLESERAEKAEARKAAARLEDELGRAGREIAYLRSLVKKHDAEAAYSFIDEGAPQNPLGECPATGEKLIDNAQLAKHKIVITAPRKKVEEVSAFDADGSALNATWEALGTLAAYRTAVQQRTWEKDVHDFCGSAPLGQFHVPQNKHARGETGTTKKDSRFQKARLLPVPKSVNDSGAVLMWSHFKPYSWAAEKKLRIHYYDQVGTDGAIYIGHIGEHLPSASTTKVHR